MTISKDFNNSIITFEFEADEPIEFRLKDCSNSIRDHLALHGAIQMAAAKANQSSDYERAFNNAEDTLAHIYEQYPESPLIKSSRYLIIEAVARIKGYSIQEAAERWNQLSQEKRTELAANPRVKAMVTVLRGEDAVRLLQQPEDEESNGARRRVYEHDLDLKNRKASMRFINGRQLEIDLTFVKDVNAIALYGAEQKISDSYSGIKNKPEKRSAAERVIHNLYAGDWVSAKDVSGNEAGKSYLDSRVVKQLTEWMGWQTPAAMQAVGHIEEQDKLRLISNEAKLLLIRYSQKFGMDHSPSKCNQRDIANLLDEVIYRLISRNN